MCKYLRAGILATRIMGLPSIAGMFTEYVHVLGTVTYWGQLLEQERCTV